MAQSLQEMELNAIVAALGENVSIAAQMAELNNIFLARAEALRQRGNNLVVVRAQVRELEAPRWGARESTMNTQCFTAVKTLQNLRVRYGNLVPQSNSPNRVAVWNTLLAEIQAHVQNKDQVMHGCANLMPTMCNISPQTKQCVTAGHEDRNLGKTALRAANYFGHNSFTDWYGSSGYDYLRECTAPEVMYLWWCAAKDESPEVVMLSSVENRKKAFVFALEEAIRGHNADNEDQALCIDNLGVDRPSCRIGYKNKFAECFKAGLLSAAHPDNVFVEEIAPYIEKKVKALLFEEYVASSKEEQRKLRLAWENVDSNDQKKNGESKTIIGEIQNKIRVKLTNDLSRLGTPETEQEKKLIRDTTKNWVDNIQYTELPTEKDISEFKSKKEKQEKETHEKRVKEDHEKDHKAAKDLAEAFRTGDQKTILEQIARVNKEKKERAERTAALAPPAAPNAAQDLAARMRAAMNAQPPVPSALPPGLHHAPAIIVAPPPQANQAEPDDDDDEMLAFAEIISMAPADTQRKIAAELQQSQPPRPVVVQPTPPVIKPVVASAKVATLKKSGVV